MTRLPAHSPRAAGFLAVLASILAGAVSGAGERPSTAAEILAAQTPELRARLQEEGMVMLQEFGAGGEVYGGMIHALVMFERPRNEVLRMLIQSPRQTEFRPELRRAELVEEYASGHVVEYEIRMMFMKVEYRARHGWDFETGHVWWSLDPEVDNDMAVLEGRWELFVHGPERTLARFGTRIDVGAALPAFLQDFATRKKLPEAMHNIRLWIESGGTFRP